MDFSSYSSSSAFNQNDNNFETSMFDSPMINPIAQYEQAYMYYKYLTQQMDYRIKCKEFEKLSK